MVFGFISETFTPPEVTIASLMPPSDSTPKRKALSVPASFNLSSFVTELSGFSGGISTTLIIYGISDFGNNSSSPFLKCLFKFLLKSLKIRLSNSSIVIAGFKSIVRVMSFTLPTRFIRLLRVSIIGPLTPQDVNSISPKRLSFIPPPLIVAVTFLSDKPCNDFTLSLTVIPTRAGRSSTILCPNFLANAYPSPVLPVDG